MVDILIANSSILTTESLLEFLSNYNNSYNLSCAYMEDDFKAIINQKKPDLIIFDEHFQKHIPKNSFSNPVSSKFLFITSETYARPEKGDVFCDVEISEKISAKQIASLIQDILDGKEVRFESSKNEFENPHKKTATQNSPLTKREEEVLSYLVKGCSNKEIAKKINLQVVTVKLHVRGICKKLKASNRTHAVLIALEKGWFQI